MTGLGMRERDALLTAIRRATLAMTAATAEGAFEMAMERLGRLLQERRLERRYNPNWPSQPRVPRGNPDGGRWTDGGGVRRGGTGADGVRGAGFGSTKRTRATAEDS